MTIEFSDVQWTQGCCGSSCEYAEVQTASGGFLQLFKHGDGRIEMARYGADKRRIEGPRDVTTTEVDAALAA